MNTIRNTYNTVKQHGKEVVAGLGATAVLALSAAPAVEAAPPQGHPSAANVTTLGHVNKALLEAGSRPLPQIVDMSEIGAHTTDANDVAHVAPSKEGAIGMPIK